jgi:DNA polymerase elongation subunit (family B)
MNPLLYGHNPRQHVVAVHQLNDRFIRLYQRIEGKIQHEDAEFFPFFFLSEPSLLEGFPKQFWLKELAGGLFYNHVAAFSRWSEMWEAVQHALKAHNKYAQSKASSYSELESILLRPDPVHQFLMQSGMTLFKGMEFDDLHRMQIDIQKDASSISVKSRRHDEPPARIVMSDNRGWYDSIEGKEIGGKEMMVALISKVCAVDPDVIEGHNLGGEILPLLDSLCQRHELDFAIGRDGSSVKHFSPRQPFWGGEGETVFYEVTGRHLIDTQRLAENFDYSARSLESLQLEYLSQYFGLDDSPVFPTPASRVSGAERRGTWKSQEPPLVNVHRVRRLSEHLSVGNFHLAQMCPFNFGTILRTGSATKIESLLIREYLRQKHSIPKPGTGTQSRGGYTDIFHTGVYSRILHADVESLYPSIMISQTVRPKSDLLNIFVPILQELTSLRLEAKRALRQAESPNAQSKLNALQSAYKVLINSFYGYLAYARACFNDYEQADRVTALGQSFLHTLIDQARVFNAKVLQVDTDGLFFIPPDNVEGIDAEDSFVRRLAASLPQGINLVTAGRYRKMLSYKKKNYALQDDSGKTIIRGSSLVSRSLEMFARQYIEQCIGCLLSGDIEKLHRTYTALHRRIVAHHWVAREFSRTETIKDDLETYDSALRQGKRPSSAPVEAAKRASLYPRPGISISYYVTGTEANVKIADNCRIAQEWDANLPDENTPHYLARLGECSGKFRDFFAPADYEKIFTTDDLFGFDPSGITIQSREVLPQRPESPPEDAGDEFPIWLGEPPSQA